ncbi:hypothetical protein H9L39_18678 [Fusarium oxysporum f. sp. albedinis]|nr:hypothetical protein H9L39_18678 [Fusarium oxysporum f. sp. albedinis]
MSCKSRADIELSPTLSFIEEKFVVGSAILRLLTLVHRLENFPGQAESNISVVLPNSVGKADRISPKKSSAPGDHDSIALVLVRPSVSRPSAIEQITSGLVAFMIRVTVGHFVFASVNPSQVSIFLDVIVIQMGHVTQGSTQDVFVLDSIEKVIEKKRKKSVAAMECSAKDFKNGLYRHPVRGYSVAGYCLLTAIEDFL